MNSELKRLWIIWRKDEFLKRKSDFTGKIYRYTAKMQAGAAKSSNEWKAQEYVIEDHGDYPRKMCFDVFGADKIEKSHIQMGEKNYCII